MAAVQVKSPAKLSHYVLQTARFEEMRDFYKTFLGAHVTLEGKNSAFMTYDDEHHRVGIIRLPGMKPKDPKSSGLLHVAFTFANLHDLCDSYKQRKAVGIEPKWCIFHGPTISMYYADPDGNQIEAQIDTCKPEEVEAMLNSEEYQRNTMGPEFDPEDLVRRVESGESEASIFKRPDVPPMTPEYIQAALKRFEPEPVAPV